MDNKCKYFECGKVLSESGLLLETFFGRETNPNI